MGGTQTRTLQIEAGEDGQIVITEAVARRLKGLPNRNVEEKRPDPVQPPAPLPPPRLFEPPPLPPPPMVEVMPILPPSAVEAPAPPQPSESKLESKIEQDPSPPEPTPSPPEPVPSQPESTPLVKESPQLPDEPEMKIVVVEEEDESLLKRRRPLYDEVHPELEDFYVQKLKDLQEKNSALLEKTSNQFADSVKEVEQKFFTSSASPVCQDLQHKVLQCYQENGNAVLNCSSIVNAFSQCVERARVAASASRVQSMTAMSDDKTVSVSS